MKCKIDMSGKAAVSYLSHSFFSASDSDHLSASALSSSLLVSGEAVDQSVVSED